MVAIAQEFSPRYERHRDDLVSVDVSGLTRLLGPARTIGEEMRREAAARGVRAHVAVAGTRMAALLLALARPGLTVIAPRRKKPALAPLAIGILEKIDDDRTQSSQSTQKISIETFRLCGLCVQDGWGLRTLGELASLPAADLVSRLGRPARAWQAMARGEDLRPLVPMLEEERFEASLDLEWPIADLEPLSFVLTRLLEPLSTRLERRDRGAAVLHVLLRLVTRDTTARRLELPTPMRDVRALRTLALLDLEAHPAEAAIDRVTIVIDPTPGRVVQHTLFTRAQPTPEQLSTLLARLGALMGQDRFGAPASVDTERPRRVRDDGVRDGSRRKEPRRPQRTQRRSFSRLELCGLCVRVSSPQPSALRRVGAAPLPPAGAGARGGRRRPSRARHDRSPRLRRRRRHALRRAVEDVGRVVGLTEKLEVNQKLSSKLNSQPARRQAFPWDRDEWDVSLSDGAVYRVFRDRDADRWFIDAIVD